MKVQVLSLLLPIFANASSFESQTLADDQLINNTMPDVERWEHIPINVPFDSEVAIDESPFGWSIMSFFGSFLSSSSPTKNSSSAPLISSSESSPSSIDLEEIGLIFNCEPSQLVGVSSSIKNDLSLLKGLSKLATLARLADIGEKALFELFVGNNISVILQEAVTSRDFHAIIFSCIKIDSTTAFFYLMDSPKFSLNAPQAVVVASIHGSKDILKFIIEEADSEYYVWAWKNFDNGEGFMTDFGVDPMSAALFLGSFKAIAGDHNDCLRILHSKGLNVAYKDYFLLKEAAKKQNSVAFEILNFNIAASNTVMNEILLIAINSSNEDLVNYLLSLKIVYRIQISTHLIPAINSQNKRIFDLIFARVNPSTLTHQVLNIAATYGSSEIFIDLIKASSAELVVSAICSCIANVKFQHYVPAIVENINLSEEMVGQGILHSVKAHSVALLALFINHPLCNPATIQQPFMEALLSDQPELVAVFFEKFDKNVLIQNNALPRTSQKLIEIKAWKTLRAFVEKYFNSPNFPKNKFTSFIFTKTDQVELAKFILKNGAHVSQSDLAFISYQEMRTLAMQSISVDLSKSQIKKHK